MYDLIYQYILDYIFNSTDLEGATSQVLGLNLTMNEYLAHTTTILCMCLIVAFGIWLVRWVFKFVGGLFLLK